MNLQEKINLITENNKKQLEHIEELELMQNEIIEGFLYDQSSLIPKNMMRQVMEYQNIILDFIKIENERIYNLINNDGQRLSVLLNNLDNMN